MCTYVGHCIALANFYENGLVLTVYCKDGQTVPFKEGGEGEGERRICPFLWFT